MNAGSSPAASTIEETIMAKTEEEDVEYCRSKLQDALDRAELDQASVIDMLNSTGIPHRPVHVQAAELREIGRFDLTLPASVRARFNQFEQDALKRHWVYRHRDGGVYVLSLARRLELRRNGQVQLYAFVEETPN